MSDNVIDISKGDPTTTIAMAKAIWAILIVWAMGPTLKTIFFDVNNPRVSMLLFVTVVAILGSGVKRIGWFPTVLVACAAPVALLKVIIPIYMWIK